MGTNPILEAVMAETAKQTSDKLAKMMLEGASNIAQAGPDGAEVASEMFLSVPPVPDLVKLAPSGIDNMLGCSTDLVLEKAYGLKPPSNGFPGIFNRIDSLQSDTFLGWRLEDIHPGLPGGTVETSQKWLRSELEVDNVNFQINGKCDVYGRLDDGRILIVDNKTASIEDWPPEKYSTQQNCYGLAVNGMDNERMEQYGLLYLLPDSYSVCQTPTPRHALFGGVTLAMVDYDPELVPNKLKQIATTLTSDQVPMFQPGCRKCDYRKAILSHAI